jgi:carboxypeptidase Q
MIALKLALRCFVLVLLATAAHAQPSPAADAAAPAVPLFQRTTSFLGTGSGPWTAQQIATMSQLRDAALADDYAFQQVRHLANNIGPRPSGSAQAAQAVAYVAAEMRALGATVALEKTQVTHWVRGEESGVLVAWPGMTPATTQRIVLTALGGSVATPPGGIAAQVLVVRSFDAFKELPSDEVKGKIVLFNHPFDKDLAAQGKGVEAYAQAVAYRGAGPSLAAGAGAVAALVRSVGGAEYRLAHTGQTFWDPALPKIPAAAVSAEDADLIADLAAQGPVRIHLTLTPQTLPKVESYNVIADWPGATHPEQVVIVSGHLDSWDLGTGAIDDGAGVAMAMQTLHLMQKLGLHAARTIRFVAWMSEEPGLDGAASYAAAHATELADYVGALESDFGCDHPSGVTFAGSPALADWLSPVAHELEPVGASLLLAGPNVGEDIAAIVSKGVPGFTPTQDSRYYFNYHHTAADTLDKVDPRHLAENAAVMAVMAYALAATDARVPRVGSTP